MRWREVRSVGASVAVTVMLPTGAHAAQSNEQGPKDGNIAGQVVPLSDFERASRWAYPARRAPVHAAPQLGSGVVGHLRLLTEDHLKEIYLVLARARGRGGDEWIQLGLPGRPNGRTGWVLRGAVGAFHFVDTALLVNRAQHRVTLRRAGRIVVTFPVGVGKPSTPTPPGRFWIREKFVVRRKGGIYGPRAMGTAAYAPTLTDWPNGGVIGFHGTDEPRLIPGSPSHGCIRLRNADMVRLYAVVPLGTPVVIV